MKNIKTNQQQGFTILELMIAVTIAGILAVIAIPSFGDLVKNNRIATQANAIVSSLHYARGEAANRGLQVRLEPIVAGTNWTAGWLVRVDGNNDGDFNDVADDIVLRNYEALKSSSLTSGTNTLIFQANGQASAANTFTLLAEDCTGEHKRVIYVRLSGLVWLDQNDRDCP
jgi:type IV fimbrial biogenesis protein FimT